MLVSYATGRFVRDAAVEAFSAGIRTVVAVAEDVPFRDIVDARRAAEHADGILIGPNTNGILTPGEAVVGMFAPEFGRPGYVGVISRSGTLSYGALLELERAGLGQSTVVGIGGGLARGTSAAHVLGLFDRDPDTYVVLLLGETGSTEEEEVADAVAGGLSTPVVALVVGAVGDPGQLMGHAGAIVYSGRGTFDDKRASLAQAGVTVAEHLGELAHLVQCALPSTTREARV
jgi:succinyl-CoA synthetase alpha subunit